MAKGLACIAKRIGDLAFADGDAPAPAAHLPGGRELRRYMVAVLVAVLPALAAAVLHLGARVLVMAAGAFVAGRLVELAVAHFRGRRTRGGALTVAVLLALLLPADAPLWAAPLGAAFGVFFAREVFGGTGHGVFNPALMGKAFLVLSFPTLMTGESFDMMAPDAGRGMLGLGLAAPGWAAAAAVLAGIVLIAARAVDWRIVCAVFIGALGTALTLRGLALGNVPEPQAFLPGGGFLFGAFVLAADPATSPGTKAGRCFYGLLVGCVAAVICGFTANAEFMMYAVLLGNVAGPTLDAAALGAQAPVEEGGAEVA